MALGEQGTKQAGAAADLAQVGAGIGQQVGNLTLLRHAAGHERAAEAAQEPSGQEECIVNGSGWAPAVEGRISTGHEARI